MKTLFTLLCLALLVPAVWAKHVPQQDAQHIAVKFYGMNNPSGITVPRVQSVTVKYWENVSAFYIFRFVSGGFVLVAADDASIPVLGYSFENNMPEVIDNPAAKEWLDNYSSEIGYIISNKLDNAETIKEWRSIQGGKPLAPNTEVLPLLTTVWDQGCYYDEMCPYDPEGPCSHTVTGCVATAMAQIMKYHNFPPQGVGEHAYIAEGYGQQSADFGNTTYDWLSMPDSVAGSNPAVATLNYHTGVSVDMGYSALSSGAFDASIPAALLDYFNYSPDIELFSRASFPDVEDFKNLLRTDLDAHLPVCYSGSNPTGSVGHEFVCDGYRLSDSTFHFNWGWAGFANGYYVIGNLNPGGNNWNLNNNVVVHIKPYNPDLIVRIIHPVDKTLASVGDTVEFKARVVRGSASLLKIFIDDIERASATVDSIFYTWNITSNDLGSHVVKVYAYNSSDTVYYKELVNVSEWITQSSGFPSGSVAIYYLSAIDSNTVWGSDQNSPQFTRTIDGGSSWTSGIINNAQGLGSSMIFGLNPLKAYAAMWRFSGNNPKGIYVTSDGGTSWVHQPSATFSNPASYPDIVHFFNANDGVTMGDPINNEYEIYTTTNGGDHWTPVPAANIPDPLTSEMGIIGYYSAIHDTIWFGTSEGRVYKSVNKGLNWTVSAAAAMAGKLVKPTFRNGSHGLLLDGLWGAGVICETFDGGITWTQVDFTGSSFRGDIQYVPGTNNTWVRSGYDPGNSGCSYSFDGGHTWTDFIGTNGTPYYPMAWVNNHCGWAGGKNSSPTEGGVYKYIGSLVQLLSPQDVVAIADFHIVDIAWVAPACNPEEVTLLGYNISRNGTMINSSLVTGLAYTDGNVPNGLYTYCVSAVYDLGESPGSCNVVDIAVGIVLPDDQPILLIYPNPVNTNTTFQYYLPEDSQVTLEIFNSTGQRIARPEDGFQLKGEHSVQWNAEGKPAGIYYYSIRNRKQVHSGKIIVLN